MKINTFYGYFEIEAENTQDEMYLQDFVENNHSSLDFEIEDYSENTFKSNEYKTDNHDVLKKLTFGTY